MSIDFQQEKGQNSADVERKLVTPRTSMISNPVTGNGEGIFVSVIHVGTITLFPPFRVKTIDTSSCPPRYRRQLRDFARKLHLRFNIDAVINPHNGKTKSLLLAVSR